MVFDFIANRFKRKKGASEGAREMDLYKLTKTLSLKDNGRGWAEPIEQEEYIARLKEFIVTEKLENHIEIIENPGKEFLGRENTLYHTKYKIIVRNLFFSTSRMENLWLTQLSIDGSNPPNSTYADEIYNGGIYLVFENNTFSGTDRSNCIYIESDRMAYIKFENNKFKNVDISAMLYSSEDNFLDLVGNEFDNRRVSLGVGIRFQHVGHRSGQWHVSAKFLDKTLGASRLENFVNSREKWGGRKEFDKIREKITSPVYNNCDVNDLLKYLYYDSQRIKIPPEHVEYIDANRGHIILRDNEFSTLNFGITAPITFEGKNIIQKVVPSGRRDEVDTKGLGVYWGRYQRLDEEGKFVSVHRQFFSDLKQLTIENNDKFQEAIINRELIRLEQHIIRKESWWNWGAWQDKLILWFGNVISAHGVSWVKPLGCLLGFNAILTILIWLFNHDINCLYVFFEMFNPVSNLAKTTGINGKNWIIALINVFQKAVLALLIYEMIRVGRRFLIK